MAELSALLVATAILVAIPGPNVALITSNSLQYGWRSGVATVFGTTLGIALQVSVVLFGVGLFITAAAEALLWFRWAGVAYLVYLGLATFGESPGDLTAWAAAPRVFSQGFMLAVINPKTLLFSAAFLPQFLPASGGAVEGMVLVAAVFLAVLFVGDLVWVALAGIARTLLERYWVWRNRLAGSFLLAAGVALALMHGNA